MIKSLQGMQRYYEVGGTRWQMPRCDSDLATCHLGVSIYRIPDGEEFHTVVA